MAHEQHGFWTSPITADFVASQGGRQTELQADQGNIYWLAQLPEEGGRQVLMRSNSQGEQVVMTPQGFSVRSRVHEYGGGAYLVDQGVVFFVNDADQCIYRQVEGGWPSLVTLPTLPMRSVRYADFCVTKDHRYLFAVRERHLKGGKVYNELVRIDLALVGSECLVASGADFYSNPILDSSETQLAWLSWSHPQMPWDGSQLWLAMLDDNKNIMQAEQVAGSSSESLYQPSWSPEGVLHVVSDKTGWWNIYAFENGVMEPVCTMPAEFGTPQWVFGTRCYDFLRNGVIVALATSKAQQQLGVIDCGQFVPFPVSKQIISPYLAVEGDWVWFLGADAYVATCLLAWNVDTGQLFALNESRNIKFMRFISKPVAVTFPALQKEAFAHAFFYPPLNPNDENTSEALPPLVVFCHGGPIAATTPELNWKIQYWTSRGFAVIDVNYGGSFGYGKVYRDRLKSQWGIVDVEDCVSAARYLVTEKKVNHRQLFIRGSSAGGLTVLSALTFYNDFTAGASYYGVSDLSGLLADTHKFEEKTLEILVGEYPAHKDRYYKRSPVNFSDQLKAPVIFFQGLKDDVVPPVQAEAMIKAMKERAVPFEYVTFENEGHGFRSAESVKVSLEAELAFYLNQLSSNHG